MDSSHDNKEEESELSITYPRILPTGDRALTVEFGNEIDEHINARLMGFIKALSEEKIKGIDEFIPSFRAVLIHYNPCILSFAQMEEYIEAALKKPFHESAHKKKIVQIPVCYEGEYAPDIEFVAKHAGISVEEVIKIHTSKPYLIFMIGFQPGFPYLGGLDERIHTPRLESPRLKLESGSVGIGGSQTGLYPLESSGGWQIIGRTPVRCYNPDRTKAIPYQAGEYIQFVAVSEEEYKKLRDEDLRGDYEFVVIEGKSEE